jgi:hypothetical protein
MDAQPLGSSTRFTSFQKGKTTRKLGVGVRPGRQLQRWWCVVVYRPDLTGKERPHHQLASGKRRNEGERARRGWGGVGWGGCAPLGWAASKLPLRVCRAEGAHGTARRSAGHHFALAGVGEVTGGRGGGRPPRAPSCPARAKPRGNAPTPPLSAHLPETLVRLACLPRSVAALPSAAPTRRTPRHLGSPADGRAAFLTRIKNN